jgi:hypothetical protein
MWIPMQTFLNFFHLERQLLMSAFSFRIPQNSRGITYFQHKGIEEFDGLFLGIGVVSLIEMFLLHQFLVPVIGIGFAWLVLALGEYSLILLRGIFQSYKLRPVRVRGSIIEIRFGLSLHLQITQKDILSVEKISSQAVPVGATKAFRGEGSLLHLKFHKPCLANRLLGKKEMISSLVLCVHEESVFIDLLQTNHLEAA